MVDRDFVTRCIERSSGRSAFRWRISRQQSSARSWHSSATIRSASSAGSVHGPRGGRLEARETSIDDLMPPFHQPVRVEQRGCRRVAGRSGDRWRFLRCQAGATTGVSTYRGGPSTGSEQEREVARGCPGSGTRGRIEPSVGRSGEAVGSVLGGERGKVGEQFAPARGRQRRSLERRCAAPPSTSPPQGRDQRRHRRLRATARPASGDTSYQSPHTASPEGK